MRLLSVIKCNRWIRIAGGPADEVVEDRVRDAVLRPDEIKADSSTGIIIQTSTGGTEFKPEESIERFYHVNAEARKTP